MHLGHVLAADGLDDVALVVRRVEAGAAPALRLAVQGGAARQGVLEGGGAGVTHTHTERVNLGWDLNRTGSLIRGSVFAFDCDSEAPV